MKIVIGVGKNENVLKAIDNFSHEIIIARSKEELLKYIKDDSIDGIIRGSLESNIFKELKNEYPNLFRASLLEKDGHKFLLTPVGIDEGESIESKINIIEECAKFMSNMEYEPKIALISSGRKDDIGRSKKIDDNIKECDQIFSILKDKYDIKHYYILLEEAINNHANIIIAPDGITGNLIFRSLVLVAGIKSNGAITLNQPKLFIDTSRSQSIDGYVNSIKMMEKLIEKNN